MHPDSDQPAKVAPRKHPRQSRSTSTVDAIVEAAARILERDGASGFTTNAVAKVAGVSIGSLYQYFPNKDAITRALIEREARAVAADARRALCIDDLDQALAGLVAVAVGHQLDRPRLALLLEGEEQRLDRFIDLDAQVHGVAEALAIALRARFGPDEATAVAQDVMTVIRVLSDAAGLRGAGAHRTVAVIGGAVHGLVAAAAMAVER